jgi:transmembrane sensor
MQHPAGMIPMKPALGVFGSGRIEFVSNRKEIEMRAAQWVAREDRGLTVEESASLASWLAESTGNRLAFLRLNEGWQRTAILGSADGKIVSYQPIYKSANMHRAMAIAASLLLVVLGSFTAQFYFQRKQVVPPTYTYTAQRGEQPVVKLVDGTRIQLDSDAQLRANMTSAARTVRLERGEAYFEVVHDKSRPFVVYAGTWRITDVGTKFSIRRDGDGIRLIVTEGQVRVDNPDASSPSAPVVASQGDVLVAQANQSLVTAGGAKEIADDLSWRIGTLTFNQETLANAADQFNRYNRRQILVQGRARNIRIGGSFRATNVDVFASLVRDALGLKVTQNGDRIVISE